jgi:anti-anti-sigma factor
MPMDLPESPECFVDELPVAELSVAVHVDAPGRTLVRLTGDVDADSVLRLACVLQPLLGGGIILLDLSGVGFMDCTALNLLLMVRHETPALILLSPQPVVRRLLDVTQSATLFHVAPASEGRVRRAS